MSIPNALVKYIILYLAIEEGKPRDMGKHGNSIGQGLSSGKIKSIINIFKHPYDKNLESPAQMHLPITEMGGGMWWC